MTKSFETFMAQHALTGSEKADGYSQDAFTDLTDTEKEIVFEKLVSELPWSGAIEWIFKINPGRAFVALKNLEEKMRGDPYNDAYELQAHLLDYSGDLFYQDQMIEDYSNYIDRKKSQVVNAIGRASPNETTIKFFEQVILTETNEDAVKSAGIQLLKAAQIPRNNDLERQIYDRLADELRSDNTEDKLRAIAEVEKRSL